MGADALVKQSEYMLDAICKSGLTEFTRRDIMRLCRSFKTADEVQPVLNHLTEYGYIAPKTTDAQNSKGRPTGQTYLVNPYLYENHRNRVLSFMSLCPKGMGIKKNIEKVIVKLLLSIYGCLPTLPRIRTA